LLEKARYLINELAKRADTTVRTIRYYTSEGLLPQPNSDGKYAYYDENHLRRLKLILRMKAAYLPLREIRHIMLSLNDEEVRHRLMEYDLPENREVQADEKPQSKKTNESDALRYIADLMETQTKFRSPEIQYRNPPQSPPLAIPRATPPANPVMDGEQWKRIILQPGVELHIKISSDTDLNQRVQQLMAYANKIFQNK